MKEIAILIPYKKIQNKIFLWNQIRQSTDELNGLVEFPGGKKEAGESIMATCTREILEETDRKVRPKDCYLFKTYLFDNKLWISVFIFLDSEGIFSEEGFLNLDDLLGGNYQIMPNNFLILEELFKYFQWVE